MDVQIAMMGVVKIEYECGMVKDYLIVTIDSIDTSKYKDAIDSKFVMKISC